MVQLPGVVFCLTLVSVVSSQTDLHAFDCRKTTNFCQNGGTCGTNGACICPGTKQNYDCSDDSTTDAPSNTCNCVTGKCKNNGVCVCPETHYGTKCEQRTIQATCGVSRKIVINVNIPNITNIEVYRAGKRNRCGFTTASGQNIPTEWAGKSRAISVPTDVMCGDAVPVNVNGVFKGYCVDLIIRHIRTYITGYDSRVRFCCLDNEVTKTIGNIAAGTKKTTTIMTTTTEKSLSNLQQASCIIIVVTVLVVFFA